MSAIQKKIISISSILLYCIIAMRMDAQIIFEGKAPNLIGTPLFIYEKTDFITESSVIIASDTVDQNGNFKFIFNTEKVKQLEFQIGNNIHLIYVEPSHNYFVEIPDYSGEELYYPNNSDSSALFYLVSRLNYEFNYFNVNNYDKFIAGTVRPDALKFIMDTEQKYKWVTNSFFNIYKEYKIAELQYITKLKGPQQIFDSYFKGKPVYFNHPEYMYFFNMFYEGWIIQTDGGTSLKKIRKGFSENMPYDTLVKYAMEIPRIGEKELAELFIMRSLFDLHYKSGGLFEKSKVDSVLENVLKNAKNEEIKVIALNFSNLINRLKPGSQYFPFEGKKIDGTLVTSDQIILKPTYFIFFNPDDPNSMKELPALNALYDRYKREINFIGLCTSCTYTGLQNFLNANKIKFECLIVDQSLESTYEIIKYPTAYIVDTDGKLKFTPALLPSEGAEKQVITLTKKGKKNDN